MFNSCDAADEGHKVLPALLLGGQFLAAVASEGVVAAAALLRFFDPFALDPTVFFQTVEEGVEGGYMELESAAGAQLDELGDIVAVARLIFQE